MKRQLVKVTAEHIKRAKRLRSEYYADLGSNCPIALALKGLGHSAVYVATHNTTIGHEYYDLPRSAQRFINRFDSGKSVRSFNFFLGEA